jgi:hypothetical protein
MEGTIATFPSLPEPEVPAGGLILELGHDGGCGMRAQLQTALAGRVAKARPVSAGAAVGEVDGGATNPISARSARLSLSGERCFT